MPRILNQTTKSRRSRRQRGWQNTASANLYVDEFAAVGIERKLRSVKVSNRDLASLAPEESQKPMQYLRTTSSSLSSSSSVASTKLEQVLGWGQFVDAEEMPSHDQEQFLVPGYAFETVNQQSGSWGRFFEEEIEDL